MTSSSAALGPTTTATDSSSILPTSKPISTSTASTSLPTSPSQISTTPATNSIQSITSQATSTNDKPTTSASSFQSSQKIQESSSTNSSRGSTSLSPNPNLQSNKQAPSNHQLSNGAVAGIVVGAALGLALITFLATFAIMRRRRQSKGQKRSRVSDDRKIVRPPRHSGSTGAPRTHDNYFPQPADDKTIQQKVRSTLDNIELHVENFYRNSSSSAFRHENGELAVFDSPYLSAPLASLLPQSRNKLNIIKHALVQHITSSLSPTTDPTRSLIPTEYTLLPSTITSTKSSVTLKPEFTQVMSRWRVTTAYLQPDPTKDPNYVSKRDRQISDIVQSFTRAFAPWKNTGYKDEERARSLSAILEDAANLGIFLFSQPSTLNFYWPAAGDIRSAKVVVSPALLKTADEKGEKLAEAWIMVDQIVQDV